MLLALPPNEGGWTDSMDIMPLFFRLTMDASSEFLFGESVNSQIEALPQNANHGNTEKADFVTAFEQSQDMIAYAFRFSDWYKLGMSKDMPIKAKVCHDYIDKFVQKVLSKKSEKGALAGANDKYVFLEALAAATDDPVEIRSQMLSIMVAGRDTTASLLSFLWISLSQHPEIFAKLRAAVLEEFGTFENPKEITFTNLKTCKYLQWCLHEALRLYPAVPGNARRSTVDTTLPRGGGPDGQSPVFIPKGTEINYSVYVMHRDTALWGADALKFMPERWQDRKAGFEFLPFNGGPR